MSETKIEQGQIWEVVTDSFLTSGEFEKHKRPTQIKKGEKIEIRFPYAWHFRTVDNYYFHAREEVILKNCKLIGLIFRNVRFANTAKLEEILRLKLYEAIDGKPVCIEYKLNK